MSAQLSPLTPQPKPSARITDWRIYYLSGRPRLIGRAVSHHSPSVQIGKVMTTSEVLHIDFTKNEAETLNTRYSLGHPSIFI